MFRSTVIIPLTLGVVAALSSLAVANPEVPELREVKNFTRGFRFDPPLSAISVAPSDPKRVYVGTAKGYIYVTRDGGQTWDEYRVRVSREKFFGAIRPTGAPHAPSVGEVLVEGSHDAIKKTRASSIADFREPFTDEIGEPTNWDSLDAIRGSIDASLLPRRGGLTQARQGAGARLGVGLRAGAPWLTLAVRKVRKWAPGTNVKQALSLLAFPPTSINWFDVNPTDPDDVFAATGEGLLRSRDGGVGWTLVFPGATANERYITCVARSPHDPSFIYVATSDGLKMSRDNGESFVRVVDARLAQYNTRFVAFHPRDPSIQWVGTNEGLFRSTDGGANFKWVFVRALPAQNWVRFIAVDPVNTKRILFTTDDGPFGTEDGGETFERKAGLFLTGEKLKDLSASGQEGHFVLATARDLWETHDGGKTWRTLYFGANEWTIERVVFAPNQPDTYWVLTWAEVLQLRPRDPRRSSPDLLARYRELIRGEPTSVEAVEAALRRAGVGMKERNKYRRASPLRALMPTVIGGVRFRDVEASADRSHRLLSPAAGLALPTPRFHNSHVYHTFAMAVMARWDLWTTIFSTNEVPADRVFAINNRMFHMLRLQVVDLYLERRRLQLEGLTDPPTSLRARLLTALRIEELTAHLNALCGALFTSPTALSLLDDPGAFEQVEEKP